MEYVDTEASEKPFVESAEVEPTGNHQKLAFWEIYKFSSKTDKCLVCAGLCFYTIAGAGPPMSSLVLGEIFMIFDPNLDAETRDALMSRF